MVFFSIFDTFCNICFAIFNLNNINNSDSHIVLVKNDTENRENLFSSSQKSFFLNY